MAVDYHAANGHHPPAFIADENGNPMHSWRVLILPYLEEQELFDRYDFTQPWNSEANLQLAAEMPSTYAFHGEYNFRGCGFQPQLIAGQRLRLEATVTRESGSYFGTIP